MKFGIEPVNNIERTTQNVDHAIEEINGKLNGRKFNPGPTFGEKLDAALHFNSNVLRGALDAGVAAAGLWAVNEVFGTEKMFLFGLTAGTFITTGVVACEFAGMLLDNRRVSVLPTTSTATEAFSKGVNDAVSDIGFSAKCFATVSFLALALRADRMARCCRMYC